MEYMRFGRCEGFCVILNKMLVVSRRYVPMFWKISTGLILGDNCWGSEVKVWFLKEGCNECIFIGFWKRTGFEGFTEYIIKRNSEGFSDFI